MLVVSLEIWPGGRTTGARQIGWLRIGNDSDLAEVSDYRFILEADANERLGIEALHVDGVVHGHRRSDNAWLLVKQVLDEAFPRGVSAYGSTFDQFLEDHGIKAEVHAAALDDLHQRQVELHRRWCLDGARRVLEEMRRRGVEMKVVGSLARDDFQLHSDIDFLVVSCPDELVYRLESIVGRILRTEQFDVIYLDHVGDDFREALQREAVDLEQLPVPGPVPPRETFELEGMASNDEELQAALEMAAFEPTIITKGDRPHLVLLSTREFDRLRGRRKKVGKIEDLPEWVVREIEELGDERPTLKEFLLRGGTAEDDDDELERAIGRCDDEDVDDE